jgi:hypothetical protein
MVSWSCLFSFSTSAAALASSASRLAAARVRAPRHVSPHTAEGTGTAQRRAAVLRGRSSVRVVEACAFQVGRARASVACVLREAFFALERIDFAIAAV